MVPTNYDDGDDEELDMDFEIDTEPSLTYAMHLSEDEPGIFLGKVDEEEAIRQMVFKTLSTERYASEIYSWSHGFEKADLRGKSLPYIMSEIPIRVNDALTVDDRIESCEDFQFEKIGKKALHVTFSVITTSGDTIEGMEVEVEI